MKVEKPIRSQSLGSIPPTGDVPNVAPLKLGETKEPSNFFVFLFSCRRCMFLFHH